MSTSARKVALRGLGSAADADEDAYCARPAHSTINLLQIRGPLMEIAILSEKKNLSTRRLSSEARVLKGSLTKTFVITNFSGISINY